MEYQNVVEGIFVRRPNRFIAIVLINGNEEVCHVKNTGRCRELLVPGARVYLEESHNPARKTKFSLLSVWKDTRLINMDSQAPNKVVKEWLEKEIWFKDVRLIRPETSYGGSRLDFYLEYGERRAFIEVKGVTLEEDGTVRFPDAPTQRGVKHIRELMDAKREGYDSYVIFVIQMEKVVCFVPNDGTHREFGDALREASLNGVEILAFDCRVEKDVLELREAVEVRLEHG